jgi:hypothetical protein
MRRLLEGSNDPPAEPEAFRLLAPQRGLFATESQTLCARASGYCAALLIGDQDFRRAMIVAASGKGVLPELSNFYCHPGKAGGSPNGLGAGGTGRPSR